MSGTVANRKNALQAVQSYGISGISVLSLYRFKLKAMSDELILVQNLIHEIRGKKVMLDFDLARLYHVETRVLNQAVKRNLK